MFGGQKSSFGGTAFGQSGGFTSSPFGGTAGNTGFGGGGGGGGFGSTQTPASGGLFGTTPAANTGIFGGGNTQGFGQNTQNSSFNFSGTQPTNAAASTGGLFGSNTPASGGLFGTPTTSSAFGAKTPAGFGQSGGLFGSTNTTSTTTGGGLFGNAGASGGGMFGANAFANQGAPTNGTTIKFNPPTGTDTMIKGGVSQNINTRHQCITAMKEYKDKSLEELRMEDYTANRKGPQAGATAGGLFGGTAQHQNTGFSFGAARYTNTVPTTSSQGMGSQANTSTAGTGLFGNTQTNTAAGGGLFGQNQNKSLFGTQTATASTGGFTGFGTNTPSTSLFGPNTQQKPGGLFGTPTSQGSGLFGPTTTQPAASFGGTTNQGFGNFGQNPQQPQQTGGLFGAKPAGMFGQNTQATQGFGFGQNTASTGGLFSKAATPATNTFSFGQPTNTTNTFGQPATGGLFGNKPGSFGGTANTFGTASGGFGTGLAGGGLGTGTSLFNQNKPTLGTGIGNTFGAGANTAFNFNSNTGTTGGLNLAGTNLGTANTAVANHPGQLQIQQQLLALASSPYGDSPLFRNLKQDDSKREEALKPTNPAAQKAVLSASTQYRVSPKPTAKIKPKPIQSLIGGKTQLFEGLDDEDSTFGNDILVPRKSIKKLIINNSGKLNNSMISTPGKDSIQEAETAAPSPILSMGHSDSPAIITNGAVPDRHQTEPSSPRQSLNIASKLPTQRSDILNHSNSSRDQSANNTLDDTLMVFKARSVSSQDSSDVIDEDEDAVPHPAGIVLRRPGYYTMPSMVDLAEMVENDECWVDNFVVGRYAYGNVFFPGRTNVYGLNLDEIVHFRRKEITVYPDDTKKPKEGEGLNKPAQVTLDCVWPRDRGSQSPIKDPERLQVLNYQDRIENASAKIGAKFIDYRPETGSWVFEVKHFSKYGLPDESDDEDIDPSKDPKKVEELKKAQQQHLEIQKKKIAVEEGVEQAMQQDMPQHELQQRQVSQGDEEMRIEDDNVRRPSGFMLQRQSEEDTEMRQADSTQLITQDMELTEVAFMPTSHQLAEKMGVDSRQVQAMKASFFHDEDDMDTGLRKPVAQGLSASRFKGLGGMGKPASPKPMQLNESLYAHEKDAASPNLLKKSFVSERVQHQQDIIELPKLKTAIPSTIEHSIIPSGMPKHPMTKKVVGSRIMRGIPLLNKSVMKSKEKLVMDMGLYHSRSCRVGWAPALGLVHAGEPVCPEPEGSGPNDSTPSIIPRHVKKRLDSTPFTVQLEQVDVCPYTPEDQRQLKSIIETSLQIQLQQSEVATDTGCPCFTPLSGIESLHKHADHTESIQDLTNNSDLTNLTAHHAVWQLIVALWGRLPDWEEDEEVDLTSYAYHMARREAVSHWLSEMSRKQITEEVQEVNNKGQSHIQSVLSYLSGRDISTAVKTSQQSGDHHMALLLAQSVGSAPVRQLIAKQLSNWQEHKADRFIDLDRLRVYTIMAGLPVWQSTIGDINTCEGWDWKRCFGTHLWYLCTPSTTVAEALNFYEEAFKGNSEYGKYAAPPLPEYLETSDDNPVLDSSLDQKHVVHDMCYHLLKLYSDRTHSLERLLAPTTYTANHLDCSLSWLVWQVMQSLGYIHLSESRAAGLCASFASQLESLGLWHWAAFVLLHIPNIVNREHAVNRLLARHITLTTDEEDLEKENFLLEKLHIPPAWVHQAKAWVAKHEGRYDQEAWHLLKAGRWNLSHQVLLQHVAARTIINEKYAFLKKYLCEMSPVEYSSSILDWAVGGKVFLDFITMIETLDEIKHGDVSAYELEKLEPEVTSLCTRIGQLVCQTPIDRLCQSEMAKRTANVLRTLLMLRSQPEHVPTKLLAPHVTKLSIPEDYALQELHDLTRSYMLEMTSC